MTAERTDIAASVRRQLLNASRAAGEDHQLLLNRFALERLLARLSTSEHRDRFVLKGAMLFALWSDRPHRATRDLELLGRGDSSLDEVLATFQQIVATAVEPDGLTFDGPAITGRPIREAASYEGLRLMIPARLGKTRFRPQVDIGFGDAVEPRPRLVDYPTVLDHASPRIKAYPPEAVVAEKCEAMVRLGLVNSRMKDFHDLWTLATEQAFEGETLCRSLGATFRRRNTPVPKQTPPALTEAFTLERSRMSMWKAFLGRAGLHEPRTLHEAIEVVAGFVAPVISAVAASKVLEKRWKPGGPWRRGKR